jgi:hypothetical protein
VPGAGKTAKLKTAASSSAGLGGNPIQPRNSPPFEDNTVATRSHTTYKKRQKELARIEKQRDKAARRMQRKLARQAGGDEANPLFEDESFTPEGPEPDAEGDSPSPGGEAAPQ